MKRCPRCIREYPEGRTHCESDSTPLVQVETSAKVLRLGLFKGLNDLVFIWKWLRNQSVTTRCVLIFFFVPFLWSLLWGFAGVIEATNKVNSPGMSFIDLALIIHFPAIFAVVALFPALPMPAGDDGAFEVSILTIITLPSCLFYGMIGWLMGKAMRSKPIHLPDADRMVGSEDKP